MLQELLIGLKNAKTLADRERWFKRLAKLGIDRTTASVLVKAIEEVKS